MYEGAFEARDMPDRETPRDELVRESMEHTIQEAAERATFHRVEAERWERVGRAAGAALKAINDPAPIQQVTPESLVGDGGVRSEPLPFRHEGSPAGVGITG